MSHNQLHDLSALIVDDERPARSELKRMLLSHGVTGSIIEAASSEEALDLLRKKTPDILFLDVQMPGGDGFSLLGRLPLPRPSVIFTTAHEQFAVRAFEEEATDYLLKPISEERLARALLRLSPVMEQDSFLTEGDSVLLKLDGECRIIPVLEIEYLETTLNTTEVFWSGHSGKLHRPLKRLLEQLDPAIFFRASRDVIVNLRQIASLDDKNLPHLSALMTSGRRILFSRRQSIKFRKKHKL